MGVAFVALVLAASGGAYAASGGSFVKADPARANAAVPLTRRQIIKLIDLKLKHRSGLPGRTGSPGPAGTPGIAGKSGPPGPSGPGVEWALVSETGAILQQSGAITVAHASGGNFWLVFPSVVAGHAISVSPAAQAPGTFMSVEATPCGGASGIATPPELDCLQGPNTTSEVFVETTGAGGVAQWPFYIEVFQ